MKSIILVLVLCAARAAWGQATQPTTQPATQPAGAATVPAALDVAALKARRAQAEEALAKARADAVKRVEESPEYKAALADLEVKKEALRNARLTGTPEQRFEANNAFGKAQLAAERIWNDAVARDAGIRKAAQDLSEAKAAVHDGEAFARRRADEAAAADQTRIRAEIRAGRLATGMTLEQARQAVGPETRAGEAGARKFYRFGGLQGRVAYEATFENGKITEFRRL